MVENLETRMEVYSILVGPAVVALTNQEAGFPCVNGLPFEADTAGKTSAVLLGLETLDDGAGEDEPIEAL